MLHTFSAGSSDSKDTKPNPERGREEGREGEREGGIKAGWGSGGRCRDWEEGRSKLVRGKTAKLLLSCVNLLLT